MSDDVRAARAAYLLTDEHLSDFARNLYACPACLGTGRVTDGPFRRDAEVDAESLRLARQDCLADYQTGRVDALDFVRAGNMLAEAK
jgi:hypothetical protein